MTGIKIKFAYKSGFRRLWLVLSVIWLLAVAFVVSDYSTGMASTFLLAGLLPVAATYVMGAACVWIIEGFAKPDR